MTQISKKQAPRLFFSPTLITAAQDNMVVIEACIIIVLIIVIIAAYIRRRRKKALQRKNTIISRKVYDTLREKNPSFNSDMIKISEKDNSPATNNIMGLGVGIFWSNLGCLTFFLTRVLKIPKFPFPLAGRNERIFKQLKISFVARATLLKGIGQTLGKIG